MLSAMSAEGLKLRRHRATWLLVWIFPIGVILLSLIGVAIQMSQNAPPSPRPPELNTWLNNGAGFWGATTSNIVRFLITAFVAVAFAGEYRWNTWKLIVPHRARSTLIASKFLVVLALLYLSFLAAALLYNGLGWAGSLVTGAPVPEGVTLGGLAQAHWKGFLASVPTVLFTVALASFAAILLRSTTGALITCIIFITLDTLLRTFGPGLALFLPGITEFVYQLMPGYHLSNIGEWVRDGSPESVPFPGGDPISYGWAASAAILLAWIGGLVALTFWRFQKQDIN